MILDAGLGQSRTFGHVEPIGVEKLADSGLR